MSVKGEINNRLTYLVKRKEDLQKERAKLLAVFKELPFITDDIQVQINIEKNIAERSLVAGQLISLESEVASLEHILFVLERQEQMILSTLEINPKVIIDMSNLPHKKSVSSNVS
jgi:hypothetical protein